MCGEVTDNPWLTISAADYEGHMGAAGVDQLAPLAAIFADVYARRRPARVAVLGCGTGTGLEAVDPTVTRRFVGVDLNPEYLALARTRYLSFADVATWICADVTTCAFAAASLDLIHAALLFEYVDPAALLPRIAGWLAPGGSVSIVLQLPGGDAAISETGFARLQTLSPLMRLVPPDTVTDLAARAGLVALAAQQVPLARGKSFWAATFGRPEK